MKSRLIDLAGCLFSIIGIGGIGGAVEFGNPSSFIICLVLCIIGFKIIWNKYGRFAD